MNNIQLDYNFHRQYRVFDEFQINVEEYLESIQKRNRRINIYRIEYEEQGQKEEENEVIGG